MSGRKPVFFAQNANEFTMSLINIMALVAANNGRMLALIPSRILLRYVGFLFKGNFNEFCTRITRRHMVSQRY